MKSLEYYRQRLWRALDHACISEPTLQPVPLQLWGFRRVVAVFGFLKRLVPAIDENKYKELLRDTSRWPISPLRYRFRGRVAAGQLSDVFFFEAIQQGGRAIVVKAEYSGTRDLEAVCARAKNIKVNYETIKAWYGHIPYFIPQQHVIILHSMQRAGRHHPMVAVLQEFRGRAFQDVVSGFSTLEWSSTVLDHPHVLENLREFLRISEAKQWETGRIIDITGVNNLSVTTGDQRRLILLDPCDLVNVQDLNPKESQLARERFALLRARADFTE